MCMLRILTWVELIVQTANVYFMFKFKLNTGSVVECDWLDQVGF
jgi:hypothetical protein